MMRYVAKGLNNLHCWVAVISLGLLMKRLASRQRAVEEVAAEALKKIEEEKAGNLHKKRLFPLS